MSLETDPLEEFRRLIHQRVRTFPGQWHASKHLLEKNTLPSTISRLVQRSQTADLPLTIKETLRRIFEQNRIQRVQDLNGDSLKALTGFQPAKAVRALCVFFELIDRPGSQWPVLSLTGEEIEEYIRRTANPFDLLGVAGVTSVLDLGAGDLSFASELVEWYMPTLERRDRPLILHCLDRLDPRSKLGGPLHPDQDRVRELRKKVGSGFAFFGNQDMFDLRNLDETGKLAPRYTIATCWAPATPTFAYEPTRLSQTTIAEDLHRTKGAFRQTRFQDESALEVQHGTRSLLFPSWKFEIVGPLALLNLLICRGALCVLGSVDAQVFWEILAQLLDEPRYRPQGQLFTPATLPEIFGEIYGVLDRLPLGQSVDLADLGPLRRHLPVSNIPPTREASNAGFRYVRITRGATLPGVPVSSTARKFSTMTEEVPPWFLTLVPI